MTIYHFTWDLEFYGWILPGTTLETGWAVFARGIATSFLFLVGVSLVLAHEKQIRWRGFWKRFLQVAGSAALITFATYLAFPQSFIFFGILHAIAVFSVIGLIFIRLSWFFALATSAIVLAIWNVTTVELFQIPVFWWIGLMSQPPVSNDYVPLFPWLAATLIGIAVGKVVIRLGLLDRIGSFELPDVASKPLRFIGRHSLIYYLLHQPVMLGLLWVFTAVAGPPDRTASFVHLCTKQCAPTRGEQFCRPYCGCVADGMKRETIFTPFHEGKIDIATNQTAQTIIEQCTAAQDE